MPTLAPGQTSNCANPVLDLYTTLDGALVDVASLEFQIWDPTGPTQVFPTSGREVVDVAKTCPESGAGRLHLGHYVATWTVPDDQTPGTYEIRWFFQVADGSSEQTFTEEFSIASVAGAGVLGTDEYTTVAALRAEGVPTSGTGGRTDAELKTLIQRHSRLIDKFTGRFFHPKPQVLLLDGTGGPDLLLGDPIISVSKIRLIARDFTSASDLDVELADVRIYNRHLTEELTNPDDRENPRLSFIEFDHRLEALPLDGRDLEQVFHPHRWPEGTQNVEVTGIFGYTDPDGSPTGKTPDLIKRACELMVVRDLERLTDGTRFDSRNAWRLESMKTRDQTIKWASPSKLGSRGVGAYTGDPEIDNILAAYTRPPRLGAA